MICRTHTANYQCRNVQQCRNIQQMSKDTATGSRLTVKLADIYKHVGDFLIFVRPHTARGCRSYHNDREDVPLMWGSLRLAPIIEKMPRWSH